MLFTNDVLGALGCIITFFAGLFVAKFFERIIRRLQRRRMAFRLKILKDVLNRCSNIKNRSIASERSRIVACYNEAADLFNRGSYSGLGAMLNSLELEVNLLKLSFLLDRAFGETARPMLTPKEQYYRTLGLTPGASPKEVKDAYRRLARQLHPDKNPQGGNPVKFTQITEAYDALMARRAPRA